MDLATCFRAQAWNNAWANHRLLIACRALDRRALRAPRTSFFPSIELTLRHILAVDLFYVGALEGSAQPFAAFDATPEVAFDEHEAAQRAVDRRLLALTEVVDASTLDQPVTLQREQGPLLEPFGRVLLHLFQHQVHHRGQVHAMLAGTPIAPPQLDEFFLTDPKERALRAPDLDALGVHEDAIWR